ncbi:unnamed protein product [Caenorhabditis nigoni]
MTDPKVQMLFAVIRSDRAYEYDMDLYNFDQAYLKMRSLKHIFSKTTKDQRILRCKRIHKHLQEILKPTAKFDYAMTDEELLKRFKSLETREAEVDKLFEYQDPYFYPWRCVFRACKRAKTALIERCESVIKKIGKENKEEK